MKIKLARSIVPNPVCTQGEIFLDGVHYSYSLELPIKDGLPGSAIPTGLYQVKYLFSHRFGRNMPHIDGIRGRSEILMHMGNTVKDTNGCVLMGYTLALNFIGKSNECFDNFVPKLLAGFNEGTVLIEVCGADTVSPSLIAPNDL